MIRMINGINYGLNIPEEYLKLDAWTPLFGAFFVSGIYPPLDCQDLPVDSWHFIITSPGHMQPVYQIMDIWNNQDNPPVTIRPIEFLIWCMDNGIDRNWLKKQSDGLITPLFNLFGKTGAESKRIYYQSRSYAPKQSALSEEGPISNSESLPLDTSPIGPRRIVRTHSTKDRNNILDVLIDQAIQDANGSNHTDAVWVQLRSFAEKGILPFVKVDPDDGNLLYRDHNNVLSTLTLNMLDGRLRRRRRKAEKSS